MGERVTLDDLRAGDRIRAPECWSRYALVTALDETAEGRVAFVRYPRPDLPTGFLALQMTRQAWRAVGPVYRLDPGEPCPACGREASDG